VAAGPDSWVNVRMKWVFLVVGVLLVLFGVVWTLQGLNYLGGSVMSGVTFWAIVGPIVAVIGLVLAVLGVRRIRA
jgi:vacuolar-type H+-ATPase subunit I/STV1